MSSTSRPRFRGRSLTAVAVIAALGAAALATVAARSQPGGVVRAGPVAVHPTAAPADGAVPSSGGEAGTTPGPELAVQSGPVVAVPILCYHYVRVDLNRSDTLGINLSVTPTLFAEQMALLHADGVTPMTLAQLVTAMQTHTALPKHPVVLTFDDGYADFATTVEPILAHWHFVATDYVVSGFLKRPGFMTAAQVLQMDRDGMVIGSHTVNHVDLATMSPATQLAEIEGGKASLEALLGHPVLDFAYPYGELTATTVSLVRAAGFRDAVTTMGGDLQSLSQRFLLRRWHMGGVQQNLASFASLVGLPWPTAAQTSAAAAAALAEVGVQPQQPAPWPSPASAPRRTPSAAVR